MLSRTTSSLQQSARFAQLPTKDLTQKKLFQTRIFYQSPYLYALPFSTTTTRHASKKAGQKDRWGDRLDPKTKHLHNRLRQIRAELRATDDILRGMGLSEKRITIINQGSAMAAGIIFISMIVGGLYFLKVLAIIVASSLGITRTKEELEWTRTTCQRPVEDAERSASSESVSKRKRQ
jgi:hypothetical protein